MREGETRNQKPVTSNPALPAGRQRPVDSLMQREKGYTLIELAMVAVIISIAALIISPALINFLHAWDLETEAKKLRADMREVQQLAISQQKTYRLEFDLANESYAIKYDSGIGSFTLVETVNLKNNIGIDTTTFTSPDDHTVDFDYFGAPSQAGNIILSDTQGNTSTISIASATGKVTIE